ncbi:MAG: glycosyltransferase [Planctomycetota bacterium]
MPEPDRPLTILMLGWEFPPFITGGLGTACHGLTRALDRRGASVIFVLPSAAAGQSATHVRLLSPENPPDAEAVPPGETTAEQPRAPAPTGPGTTSEERVAAPEETIAGATTHTAFRHVRFIDVDAGFVSPYQIEPGRRTVGEESIEVTTASTARPRSRPRPAALTDVEDEAVLEDIGLPPDEGGRPAGTAAPVSGGATYGGDLIEQVGRYARFCLDACRNLQFDVIHAHDWMTYPAALAIARATGRPLVVHVHSTEFDRSGEHVNQRVYDIERRGMHGAMRVITVSQLTGNVVVRRYGVPAEHVDVVYNGVDLEPASAGLTGIRKEDKIVLYFGRITYQKGPEYFIRAAKRVLEVLDDVKFVVAGSGDQARSMIEMAAALGIGHKVLFTGFLRGRDIPRVFAMADLYVMPSVSEPFGIAPLEAMGHDVPVLISRSSGVSEVLTHALKVNFWDIDDMADKIVAVLRHPPLSTTLREHGSMEVRRITWDGAAAKCEQVYRRAIDQMTGPVVRA